MHNVERIGEGEFVGWISGGAGGHPSCIDLSCSDRKLQVFAVRERLDVFHAGFTRFSGFDLRISAHSRECLCRAELEGKEYDIAPSVMVDADLIKVDDVGRDYLSGWVNFADGLRSLSFFSVPSLARAEIHMRSDINAFLNTPSERLYGFHVQGLDVSRIFAVKVNNALVHWVAPDWLARGPRTQRP